MPDSLQTHTNTLSMGIRIAYASPGFVLSVVGVPLYVYIPKFYTDVVGVDITVMGILILAARLVDGVSDPLVGILSDATRTRFGRRRPYIAAASIALSVILYLLYAPPQASQAAVSLWFAALILLLSLTWTLVDVPWESLAPEIAKTYDARSSLIGWRESFTLLGTLVAVASPPAISHLLNLPDTPAGERSRFAIFGAVYAPLVTILCWWCVLGVRENVHQPSRRRAFWRGWKEVVANRPFRILLGSYMAGALGANLPGTLILYYVHYVLRSGNAEIFLLIYFATGILFLPLWVLAAKKIEKRSAWLTSMALNTGAFAGVFFLGPGDTQAYGILTALSGVGFGAGFALPAAMQADVIDCDELASGQRREGRYIGIWAVSRKIASALGMGLALPLLGWMGYRPGVEQSEAVTMTLRVLYCLVPVVCNLAAMAIALAYPITREQHERIRAALERSRAGGSERVGTTVCS